MLSKRSISVDRNKKKTGKLPLLSPSDRASPDNLLALGLPDWLLNRTDFKRSLEEKVVIKNFDFSGDLKYDITDRRIVKNQLKRFSFIKEQGKSKFGELLSSTKIMIVEKGKFLEPGLVYLTLHGRLIIDQEISVGPTNILHKNLDLAEKNQIKAESDCTLLTIPSDFYEEITHYTQIRQTRSLSKQLIQIPLFNDLKLGQLQLLSQKILILDYQRNSVVYETGEKSEYFYIIIEGECDLVTLVTLKSSNYMPSFNKIREKIHFESKFNKVKEKLSSLQLFGIKEAITKKNRNSAVHVVSEKARLGVLKLTDFEDILKPAQLSKIKEAVSLEESQEFSKKVFEDLKFFKRKFNALLDASCIKSKPNGRDIFEGISKRKKMYIEGLENSHRINLRGLSLNCTGKNVTSFY